MISPQINLGDLVRILSNNRRQMWHTTIFNFLKVFKNNKNSYMLPIIVEDFADSKERREINKRPSPSMENLNRDYRFLRFIRFVRNL